MIVTRQNLIQTILDLISADALTQNVNTIYNNNRWSDFRKYADTADQVEAYLHGYGLNAERLEMPMDGETNFGDAVMPLAWKCDSATLEMTDPEVKLISRYSDTPNLVGMWSPPTPDEGIEASVVLIPDVDVQALEKHDVSGKFILTNARPYAVREAAAQKNALGIISYHMPYPGAKTATQWLSSNTNTPGGWGTKKNEDQMILLALSPQKGEALAQECRERPVQIRVSIQSELYESKLPILHTHIKGTHVIPETNDNIEVLVLAPLYGQGVNDHAVSTAVLMESARILQLLVDENSLKRPMRGIRFLFSPKVYGPVVFAHERKAVLDRTIYGLCVDAGAGDPDHAWSRWGLRFGPVHKRHFADGVMWQTCQDYLKHVRPQRFVEQRDFSLGADVWFNDPALNLTTHWLSGGTSVECKFTDLDTPDTVDSRSLVDLSAVVASALYTMASVDVNDVPLFAQWNYQLSHERVHKDATKIMKQAERLTKGADLKELFTQSNKNLQHRIKFEKQSVQTLEHIIPNVKDHPEWDVPHIMLAEYDHLFVTVKEMIQSRIEARAEQLGLEVNLTESRGELYSDSRVPLPEGLTLGTVTLDSIAHQQWGNPVKTSPRRNLPYILSWWLMDCQRTISDIEDILKMELGEFRECIPVWFDFLQRHGYIVFEGDEAAELEHEVQPESAKAVTEAQDASTTP
jgi:hypothetical protein